MTGLVVLKFGGELLEDEERLKTTARVIARAARKVKLVVVHGGGREIDAALAQAGIVTHQVDGLRITDQATLQVVVAVLAGTINTRLVAAINAAGGQAVGLTGADAGLVAVRRAKPHRASTGEQVDLGLVGEPVPGNGAPLVDTLCRRGFVPVIACIAAGRGGQLLNVNADTLAGSLATRLKAARLVIAGSTAGVLDARGQTMTRLDGPTIDQLVRSGAATAGMIAKLRACLAAHDGGIGEIAIVDGRSPKLEAVITGTAPRRGAWTRVA